VIPTSDDTRIDWINHNNLSLLCPNCHRMAHEGKLKKENLKNLNSTLPDNWKESYYG
jgi:predicted HNH restriction endonuclease